MGIKVLVKAVLNELKDRIEGELDRFIISENDLNWLDKIYRALLKTTKENIEELDRKFINAGKLLALGYSRRDALSLSNIKIQ